MRSLLMSVHRWLALVTSLLLVAIALSGAAIVFEGSVADASTTHVTPGARWLSLDTLGARAIAAAGGGEVAGIAFGRQPDQAFTFAVVRDTSEQDLTVDPYTGAALGPSPGPTRLQTMLAKVHQFHTRLLAGAKGSAVVAFVTLSSLVLVLIGLVLWWRDKLWRIRWSASWKRIVFDIHHALGVFAAVVLLIITGTGVWMGFPKQVDPLVLAFNSTAVPAGQPRPPAPEPGATPVSLDSIIRAANGAVPGAPVVMMQQMPNGAVMVALRYPEDHTPGGRSRVFIDRFRGTVLRSTNTRTAEAGTKLMNLQRPLHTGDIFGSASRIVWFLAAVILSSQAVTGVLMWWNGRAGRRKRSQRGSADPAAG